MKINPFTTNIKVKTHTFTTQYSGLLNFMCEREMNVERLVNATDLNRSKFIRKRDVGCAQCSSDKPAII